MTHALSLSALCQEKQLFRLFLQDSFEQALAEMTTAAERGKESTKDLVTKIGRASRLGERSRGVLDAGATSCYLILNQLGQSVGRYLTTS